MILQSCVIAADIECVGWVKCVLPYTFMHVFTQERNIHCWDIPSPHEPKEAEDMHHSSNGMGEVRGVMVPCFVVAFLLVV